MTRRKGDNDVTNLIDKIGTLVGNAASFVAAGIQLKGPLKLLKSLPAAVDNFRAATGNGYGGLFDVSLPDVAGNIKIGAGLNLAAAASNVKDTANNLKNEGTWGSQSSQSCRAVACVIHVILTLTLTPSTSCVLSLRNAVNRMKGAVDNAIDGLSELSDLSDVRKAAVKNIGQLAAGVASLASNLQDPFKAVLKCIGEVFDGDLCPFVLKDFCQCDAGSHLNFRIDSTPENPNVDMKCVLDLGCWAAKSPKDTPFRILFWLQ